MCIDLILSGNTRPRFNQAEQIVEDYAITLGGSANIFASQIAKLGSHAAVIGILGDDPFGRFAFQQIEAAGVSTEWVRLDPSLRTGIGVALQDRTDRAILTWPGTIDALQPGDLSPAVLERTRHWHIAGYYLLAALQPGWPSWIARCRAGGVTVSIDPNWDPANHWKPIRDLLPSIDLFLPNASEALAISGESDVQAAGRRLSALGPAVVIKQGEAGATVFRNGEVRAASNPPPPPPCIRDTVGAGDCFDAGYLHAWLHRRPDPECLDLANRCAVASLAAPGGIEGQLRLDPAAD